jgi:hypothetical protein
MFQLRSTAVLDRVSGMQSTLGDAEIPYPEPKTLNPKSTGRD